MVINASHTHSGPGGFGNSPALNFAAPSLGDRRRPADFVALADQPPADRQLYTFLVNQIAAAVARADDDLAPAALGWGQAELTGVTRNRSLEAHLANHGVIATRGEGRSRTTRDGALHTIDPRRGRAARGQARPPARTSARRVPIGGWSIFPDHGTVTKSSFEYYNQDHHASGAARVRGGRAARGARAAPPAAC